MIYPVHRSRALAIAAALLWLFGAVSVAVWATSGGAGVGAADWRLWLAAAALLASAAGAVSFCKSSGHSQIVWDAEVWRVEASNCSFAGGPCIAETFDGASNAANLEIQVILDVQVALLLRLARGRRAGQWLWVTRSHLPERWLDLRRAVYSPVRHVAPVNCAELNASGPETNLS